MYRLLPILLLLFTLAAPLPAAVAKASRLKEYQAAVKHTPGNAVAQHNLGVSLNELKRYPEAVGPLRTALKLKSNDVQYYLDLAWALYYLKSLDEGEAVLKRAAAAFPKNGSVYYYQGAYRLARGKQDEALALLEKAVALDPKLKKDIRDDDDLAALRKEKRFQRLTGG